MLRQLISYPKNIFRSLDLRSQISKRIMWIISKSHHEIFFFDIIAIHLSSRHEKHFQICVGLFCLFPCSRNEQWAVFGFLQAITHTFFKEGTLEELELSHLPSRNPKQNYFFHSCESFLSVGTLVLKDYEVDIKCFCLVPQSLSKCLSK